jgi:hypothetical protein
VGGIQQGLQAEYRVIRRRRGRRVLMWEDIQQGMKAEHRDKRRRKRENSDVNGRAQRRG